MDSLSDLVCPTCGNAAPWHGGLVICPSCGEQLLPRSPGARRFLLDSNAYDHVVAEPAIRASVVAACERGDIELLMTHVQHDELLGIPDPAKRASILALPFVIMPTYGVVLGVSRVGLARLGAAESIDVHRSPSGGHARDALLAATTEYDRATLVTNDRRLRNSAIQARIPVWSSREFMDFVHSLFPASEP